MPFAIVTFTFLLIKWVGLQIPPRYQSIWCTLTQEFRKTKKLKSNPSNNFKTAVLLKSKQTPQRRLVSKNWITQKTKKLVFDLMYDLWKFESCRSNHYRMRAFSNFGQNPLKMAILDTQINRWAVTLEPDYIERCLMAFWDPLMTLRLGQQKFFWGCVMGFTTFTYMPS